MGFVRAILHPVLWMLISIIVQCYAAWQEMFAWPKFAEDMVGLSSFLAAEGASETLTAGMIEMTAKLGLNQGFYNLFLAVGILLFFVPMIASAHRWAIAVFSLICMAAAGAFGLVTVPEPGTEGLHNAVSFAVQGVPPVLALVGLVLARAQEG